MDSGPPSSEPRTQRISHRPEQITLVEDVESPSIPPRPTTEKTRALLTLLTGSLQGTLIQVSGEITLGRSKNADIFIPDPGLSRLHARLAQKPTSAGLRYLIVDCDSTNGTFVRGRRIEQAVWLSDGDRIGLGCRTVLRFSLQDPLEEQALVRVHQSALHDRLTGVHNRGVLEDRLQSELSHSARRGTSVAILLIDIDYFKKVNDTHGHAAGDAVLKTVARGIQAAVRPEDVVARYGGEEFAVIFRGVSLEEARTLAEQVRTRVANDYTPWRDAPLQVTVSVGVAHLAVAGKFDAPAALTESADRALYSAKQTGRNRVIVAD